LKSKRTHNQTVTGILIPEKWDEKGNVVGLSIQTFDERGYIIKAYKLRKELLQFINQTVAITGKVSERLDGRQIIEASHFGVINSFEEV
jgi:hypothetical protein